MRDSRGEKKLEDDLREVRRNDSAIVPPKAGELLEIAVFEVAPRPSAGIAKIVFSHAAGLPPGHTKRTYAGSDRRSIWFRFVSILRGRDRA